MLTNKVYTGCAEDEKEVARWAKQNFKDLQHAAAAQMELWGEPDTGSVFFCEQAGHFNLEEEDRPFCRKAKTRLTDDSVRMAFVTPEETKILQGYTGGVYDKEFAQSVLRKSFSIRPPSGWDIHNLPQGVFNGTGLLRGVVMMESLDEAFEWEKERIWNDEELGIRREKRR